MADLNDIPGLNALWQATQGAGVSIGMIEGGPINAEHSCLLGADMTVSATAWRPPPVETHDILREHGTFSASLIWGQHGTGMSGVAPESEGFFVPAFVDAESIVDPLNFSHAVDRAIDQGVDVLYIGVAVPTLSGAADPTLKAALERAAASDVLLVACAGNLHGECPCVPAIMHQVLAVGAHDEHGAVCSFSNFGPQFADHGIVAPGTDILGAYYAGGLVRRTGTSVAGPIAAGVGALLIALRRSLGLDVSANLVRDIMLKSAKPCADSQNNDTGQCLCGRLNVTDAVELASRAKPPEMPLGRPTLPRSVLGGSLAPPDGPILSSLPGGMRQRVYALGELGYDFGTEARRDTFKQLMAPQEIDGTVLPPNPYDARQMVDHLANNPSEARSLIWTLNLELTPIYALEASGSFAAEIYGLLTRLLTGSVAADDDPAHIERVAIPGVLSGRSVKLYSGQVVPIVEIEQIRGLYGWEVNKLVEAAVSAAQAHGDGAAEVATITENLREFLTKIYYDLRNLGTMSRDRALNFAATNAFQAAQTFASALSRGMAVDTINVEKSPFCRLDSDCWDVQLRFFDPENSRRARRVYRFTIDVSDTMPVTLGEVRTWTAPQ